MPGSMYRAIVDFNAAIALDAKVPTLFSNRGRAFMAKPDYGRAVADFGAAIALTPKRPEAYVSRAEAYEKQGDLARARADVKKAAALAPRDEAIKALRKRLDAPPAPKP